jgi:hypothetical protein
LFNQPIRSTTVATVALKSIVRDQNQKRETTKPTGFVASTHGWIQRVIGDSNLECAAVRVGVLLALYTSYPRWQSSGLLYAWPSVPLIAGLLDIRRASVLDAINELTEHGYITTENGRYRLVPETCEKTRTGESTQTRKSA